MNEPDVSVLKIPKADEDHINVDKENVSHQIIANKTAEMDCGGSCPRIPLQSINQDRDGVTRPVYSPITPVSGTRSRTPHSGRKSTTPHHRRKTVDGFRLKQSPMNVMNTLLYNKAKELIVQGLQEERNLREALVGEKDEEILRLKAEVSLLRGRPTDASTFPDSSIPPDDNSLSTCKLSGVDYSKKTKDELVTELVAFEKDNRALRVDLQKYQLLKLELVHTRTARDDDRLCSNDTSEQVKVSLEQKITELLECQSQLTHHVSEREKEAASCRSELQLREQEVASLNESLAKLQDDLSRIYEQKQRETSLCNEYRCQRQKDIKRLQELEARLDEFAQIRPNIIRAKLAQENIANVIRKAHQTVLEKNRRVAAEREEFLKQKVEWLQWKNEKELRLAAAIEAESNCSPEEVTWRQAGSLQRDLASQPALAEESRLDGLLKQISSLESFLENEKCIKRDLTEKLSLAEKQATDLNEQLTAAIERRDLEVTNLQRTLDMREHEFDELTKECNNYKRLVTHLKAQATKHQAIISKVVDLEMQIEMLEKEKAMVCDEMPELRKKSTELQQLKADHLTLREKMQSLETSLIEKDQQIRCKEAELSNAVTAVELLSKKAASFYDKLTSQWRAWSKTLQVVKQTETGTPQRRRSQARTPPVASGRRRSQARTPPVTSSRRRSRKSFGRQSFIYQILSASKQQSTEPHGNKTAPVLKIYGGPAMEGESTSQDRAVMERDGATEVTAREPESETPLHTIRRGSRDSNCSDGADVVSLHSSSSSSYGERFTSFVEEVATIFTKMESLLHGEVIVAFSQLRNLVKSLENHLSQQQQTHKKLMKEAQMIVNQMVAEAGEERRKAQVAIQCSTRLREELNEKTENTNRLEAMLQKHRDKLTQLSDQSTEIKKVSKELSSAQKQCELKDEEIRLLRSSLNELCTEASSDSLITVVKDKEKEIISLTIQKQKLLQEYAEDRRQCEESRFRQDEQHRNDVKNLRKAEQAIGQLDEKIERIRLALQPHLNILKTDESIHPILREIRAID